MSFNPSSSIATNRKSLYPSQMGIRIIFLSHQRGGSNLAGCVWFSSWDLWWDLPISFWLPQIQLQLVSAIMLGFDPGFSITLPLTIPINSFFPAFRLIFYPTEYLSIASFCLSHYPVGQWSLLHVCIPAIQTASTFDGLDKEWPVTKNNICLLYSLCNFSYFIS